MIVSCARVSDSIEKNEETVWQNFFVLARGMFSRSCVLTEFLPGCAIDSEDLACKLRKFKYLKSLYWYPTFVKCNVSCTNRVFFSDEYHHFVLQTRTQVVACASIDMDWKTKESIEIHFFCAIPSKGLGIRMMTMLFERCLQINPFVKRMTLFTLVRSRKFYQRIGFKSSSPHNRNPDARTDSCQMCIRQFQMRRFLKRQLGRRNPSHIQKKQWYCKNVCL